jgi:hypothetical protein
LGLQQNKLTKTILNHHGDGFSGTIRDVFNLLIDCHFMLLFLFSQVPVTIQRVLLPDGQELLANYQRRERFNFQYHGDGFSGTMQENSNYAIFYFSPYQEDIRNHNKIS